MFQKRSLFGMLPLYIFLLFSYQQGSAQYKLTAVDFRNKIDSTATPQLIDVRTPGEFAGGHLKGALNMDWDNANFDKKVSALDKTKPVFVYCLSGGRSAYAAARMRSTGFKEVYELQGGIIDWRSAGFPEAGKLSQGMSELEYNNKLITDKVVLVDFYTPWCTPCKKMEPILQEIAKDNMTKVLIVRINADENQRITKTLKVVDFPAQFIYKNGKLVWQHTGFMGKEYLLKELKL